MIDLASVSEDTLEIKGKLGLAVKIAEAIRELVPSKRPSQQAGESLRGMLGFSRAQCFGRWKNRQGRGHEY